MRAKEEALAAGLDSRLYQLWGKCQFGLGMVRRFLQRNGLSRRRVSCLKTMSLSETIPIVRGFFQQCIVIHLDAAHLALRPLDPTYGRFLLFERINKDEVPLFFGFSSSQIDETTSRATHVMRPTGFGDRFATLDLAVTADGVMLVPMLIFHGTGARVESYDASEGCVVVYQAKAWKDAAMEMKWYRLVLKPYRETLQARGNGFGEEMLVTHDNVGAHHNIDALRYAHQQCGALSLNSPPNVTHVAQLIDDNIGKMFRDGMNVIINAALDTNGASYKWTAKEKRALVVAAAREMYGAWTSDSFKIQLLRNAALRTGLAISVEGLVPAERTTHNVEPGSLIRTTNAAVRPTRFPVDFGLSFTDPSHAGYEECVSFVPFVPRGVVAYDPLIPNRPAPASLQPNASPPASSPALLQPNQRGEEAEADLEEDGWMDRFSSSYFDEAGLEEFIENGEEDDADNQLQFLERTMQRGCLPGCSCEEEPYQRGCMCFKKRSCCMEHCACSCSRAKSAPVIEESDYINVDTAIGENEGEEEVLLVSSHEEDDGALYFDVAWVDGAQTEEPLENLLDSDGRINNKLMAYAELCGLDLAPYVEVVLRILQGQKDIVFSADEDEVE